jgi:hypothetical protein
LNDSHQQRTMKAYLGFVSPHKREVFLQVINGCRQTERACLSLAKY